MKPRRPVVIAHRGFSEVFPENSVIAFEAAQALADARSPAGLGGVECDVHLLRDGQVAVIHDFRLGRTARVAGRGRKDAIATLDAKDLRRSECGEWKEEIFRGQRIPLLGEALRAAPRLRWYVELKMGRAFDARLVDATLRTLRREKREEYAVLHSFHPDLGPYLRKRKCKATWGFLFDRMTALRSIRLGDWHWLHPHWPLVASHAKDFVFFDKPLHLWTIRTAADLRRLNRCASWPLVQGLIMNDPWLIESFRPAGR